MGGGAGAGDKTEIDQNKSEMAAGGRVGGGNSSTVERTSRVMRVAFATAGAELHFLLKQSSAGHPARDM
jgi:hypothetical protein